MRDLVYVLITLAFFALCVGLVRGCDALIGADSDELDEGAPSDVPAMESAGSER